MDELPLCEREDQRREGKEWLVLNGLASISLFMSSAGRPDIIQWITFLQFWKPSLCVFRTWPSTCVLLHSAAAKQMAFRIHFLDMLHVLSQNTSEYIQEGLKWWAVLKICVCMCVCMRACECMCVREVDCVWCNDLCYRTCGVEQGLGFASKASLGSQWLRAPAQLLRSYCPQAQLRRIHSRRIKIKSYNNYWWAVLKICLKHRML